MYVVLQTGAGVVRVADLSSAARGLDSGSAAVPGCCVGGHWHHYPVTPHCNTGTPGHKLILVISTVMNTLYSEKAFYCHPLVESASLLFMLSHFRNLIKHNPK